MTTFIPKRPRLSKSRFLSGRQCHKRLYFEAYTPELAAETDGQRQAMLDMGKQIGDTAQQCFPGGQLVTEGYRQSAAALERTATFMTNPDIPAIFEAAFQYEGTLIRVDILERSGEQTWRLIEVKASSRVKAVHYHDLAIQTHVLQGAGIAISHVCLMHINRHYVFQGGDIDLRQLFVVEDLTEEVFPQLSGIPDQLEQMRAVLTQEVPPVVKPDGHCHTPYECPFWEHCTQEKSERWIYHLPGTKEVVRRMMKQGIELIDDIPFRVRLSTLQQRVKDNVEWLSPELEQTLKSVHYPIHHLDFETFMPAIPLYSQTRPYQPVPTQWSNHIEREDGTLQHETYLCTDHRDPREELAVALLSSLGQDGSICVYSDYEKYVLTALAEVLPSLRTELLQLTHRLWDLLSVIQSHYYHPGFAGSFSIKSVLPTLVPSLSYSDLEIRDGATASAMYHQMVFKETDWVERQRIASALHEYCARDTLGMVELRRILAEKVQHRVPSTS